MTDFIQNYGTATTIAVTLNEVIEMKPLDLSSPNTAKSP
jgi:hypothetical protein